MSMASASRSSPPSPDGNELDPCEFYARSVLRHCPTGTQSCALCRTRTTRPRTKDLSIGHHPEMLKANVCNTSNWPEVNRSQPRAAVSRRHTAGNIVICLPPFEMSRLSLRPATLRPQSHFNHASDVAVRLSTFGPVSKDPERTTVAPFHLLRRDDHTGGGAHPQLGGIPPGRRGAVLLDQLSHGGSDNPCQTAMCNDASS